MSARPFLLLSIRDHDVAADDEFAAIRRFGGLADDEVTRIRLDREPLGAVDLDAWAGVILGGGPYTVSDPEASKSADQRRTEAELRELLARIVERDTPFLGCCYGIGTLGVAVGAVVDRTYGEAVGTAQVSVTQAGARDPLFAGLPTSFEAFVGHKEAISALPAHAVTLATSPTCPVQAFRVGTNVYATQFHPELDAPGLCTRIEIYKHAGYFEPARAEQLKAAARAHEVVHPTAVLRRFVQRYRDSR